ncbi:MAG: DsbA family protein [Chitinophagaceae bacterium]|nr:MAG: DsbA family protein [Chitinophagaceae bacterium]
MALRPPVSDADHIEGNPNATIELVKYGDYQCPHCARAYLVVHHLQEELGDQLKFVFRNFPLQKIHPEAVIAAIAAEAAALQGRFWEMHDLIFENQDELSESMLLELAAELDLDMDKFRKDLGSEELAQKVDNDFESGIRSGVNATPTFFINDEKYNEGWESDRMLQYIRTNNIGK